jgi:hypothetical protein
MTHLEYLKEERDHSARMVALFANVYRSMMQGALDTHGITSYLDAFCKFDKAYLAELEAQAKAFTADLPVK